MKNKGIINKEEFKDVMKQLGVIDSFLQVKKIIIIINTFYRI